MRNTVHVATLAVTVVLALLLVGCSTNKVIRAPGVDVGTQELQAVKQQAGIKPCVAVPGPAAADGLPDVTLPCLGGGPEVNLAGLRGPMVVNLWAQWCEPCRRELPIYQRFFEKYAGTVGVLGVDWQDTQPLLALRLAEQTGVTYPLLADPESRIRARGLPRLILLDTDGKIAYDQYLEIRSLGQLERLVAQHLGVT